MDKIDKDLLKFIKMSWDARKLISIFLLGGLSVGLLAEKLLIGNTYDYHLPYEIQFGGGSLVGMRCSTQPQCLQRRGGSIIVNLASHNFKAGKITRPSDRYLKASSKSIISTKTLNSFKEQWARDYTEYFYQDVITSTSTLASLKDSSKKEERSVYYELELFNMNARQRLVLGHSAVVFGSWQFVERRNIAKRITIVMGSILFSFILALYILMFNQWRKDCARSLRFVKR